MAQGLNKVVSAIMALVVLVALLTGFGLFKAPVTQLAEWIANIVQPWGNAVPFKETGKDQAYDSVQALLYGINRVAWWDNIGARNSEEFESFEKTFNQAKAIPTFYDADSTSFSSLPSETVIYEIINELEDCKDMYDDKGGENTLCSTFSFKGYSGEIIKKDIDKKIDEEKEKACGKLEIGCRTEFNQLKSKTQIETNLKDPNELMMCAKQHWLTYRIFLTDNLDTCKLPQKDLDFKFGMKIENFELPQQIAKDDGTIAYKIEDWLDIHGDPKYIVYYEVFPEDEDKYWQPAIYKIDFITIVTIEGIFMILGAAGPLTKLVGVGGKQILSKVITEAIPAILKNPLQLAKNGFKEIFEGLVNNGFKSIFRKGSISVLKEISEEYGEEVVEKILIKQVGEEVTTEFIESTFKKNGWGILTEEVEPLIKELNERMIPDTLSELGEKAIRADGKGLSIEAEKLINERIVAYLKKNSFLFADDIASELMQSIGKNVDLSTLARNLELSKRVNVYIIDLMNEVSEENREKIWKDMFKDIEFPEAMKPRDLSELRKSVSSSTEFTMELQGTTVPLIENLFNSQSFKTAKIATAEEFQALTRIEQQAILDSGFDEMFGPIIKGELGQKFFANRNAVRSIVGLTGSAATELSRPRHVITAMAVLLNHKILSIKEKFTPVGTNAIGVRTPFMQTEIYDETFTEGWNWEDNREDYLDFFKYFGGYEEEGINEEKGTRYKGLLPDVGEYYIALQKDKNRFWLDQPNQRFHLVSPCKADVYIRATTCECYGYPQESTIGTHDSVLGALFEKDGIYETGVYNKDLETTISNFDGKNKMLYTIGENGVIVKECNPQNVWKEVIGRENLYNPQCIVINPVLEEDYENNYCYHGQDSAALASANVLLNWVIPIGMSVGGTAASGIICGALSLPAGGIAGPACGALGGAIGGFIGGVGGGITYAALATDSAWPNHRGELLGVI